MNKYILLALTFAVGATFSTADAKKKDKKAPETNLELKKVGKLKNGTDSLSYTAGIVLTNGLYDYLKQIGVEENQMDDFTAGFWEAITTRNDVHETARRKGKEIAGQVIERMVPNMKAQFTDTPDSISEELLYRGFLDVLLKDTTVFSAKNGEKVYKEKETYNKESVQKKQIAAGKAFLEENAKKEGVITTASGLQYKVLKQGDGKVPGKNSQVKVNYEGRLTDGTVFDASSKHGDAPASFRADQVIAGWTEALTMMPVGSKWQLYIPQELAYGSRAAGQIPPYSTLIFDVELVGIDE